MKGSPDNVWAEGRDCLGGSSPSPGVLVGLGRMGHRSPLETHQDSGQLSLVSHIQMEDQAVGQGSTQQQDEGEEDAEVGRGEICRSRKKCLWPGSQESTAPLRSHSVSGPGDSF